MRFMALAFLAVALVACQTTATIPDDDPVTQGRVDGAMAWIARNSDLPLPAGRPAVVWLPLDQIQALTGPLMAQRPASLREGQTLTAFYIGGPDKGRIYVPIEARQFSTFGHAMLLHEMVHYMQHQAGRRYRCNEELEREAYRLTFLYMQEQAEPVDPYFPGGTKRYLDSLVCRDGADPNLPAWAR